MRTIVFVLVSSSFLIFSTNVFAGIKAVQKSDTGNGIDSTASTQDKSWVEDSGPESPSYVTSADPSGDSNSGDIEV